MQYIMHGATASVLKLSVAANSIFSLAVDGRLAQHDATTGALIREFKSNADCAYAMDQHAGKNLLCAGGYDGVIRLWSTQSGAPGLKFRAAPGLKLTETANK